MKFYIHSISYVHAQIPCLGKIWFQRDLGQNDIGQLECKVFKVGVTTSKNNFFISFNDSPLKMMKNAFHFILKALFVLKIFKFLSCHFGHVEKRLG